MPLVPFGFQTLEELPADMHTGGCVHTILFVIVHDEYNFVIIGLGTYCLFWEKGKE